MRLKTFFLEGIALVAGVLTILQCIGYSNIWGGVKGMFEYLFIKVDLFWVTFPISLVICIFCLAIHKLMKRYDELSERAVPMDKDEIILIIPDKFLTVDKSEVSVFPTLHFLLDVKNCSYYSFEPKKVELTSYNNGKEVGEDVWDKEEDGGYKSAKGYIRLGEQLPKWGGSYIDFNVPIEKRYDEWHSWDLEGYVTYTDGEKNWKVQIETRHHLFEKGSMELLRQLEKAL